tara:strand:+ start:188 stop:610 length:423 start_codon:yes stop_codon:yes gene_type:complete
MFLFCEGPAHSADAGSFSAFSALAMAESSLRNDNDISMAVVVSVHSLLDPMFVILEEVLGLASESGRCKPFDKSADGYVCAEAGACLLLSTSQYAAANTLSAYAKLKVSYLSFLELFESNLSTHLSDGCISFRLLRREIN